MEKWINEHFKDEWTKIETDIDFTDETPFETHSSLHIYEERYIIENETYRLLYAIGHNSDPLIEKLKK